MKMKSLVIIYLILILANIICAAVICCMGITGWGWFLFVAVLMAGGFSYKEKSKSE